MEEAMVIIMVTTTTAATRYVTFAMAHAHSRTRTPKLTSSPFLSNLLDFPPVQKWKW